MRKMYFVIVAAIVFAIIGYYTYLYIGPVKPFYTKNEVAAILQVEPDAIAEIYEAEEKYRFIPYEKDGKLHMSFWEYRQQWEYISDYMGHDILMWTIKNKHRYIVWHYKADKAAALNIYGVQERNYHVSSNEKGEDLARYYPQIVLHHEVEQMTGTHYGIFEVPADWNKALSRTPVKESFSFFDDWQFEQPLFQYSVVDENGEVVDTVGVGNSYGETHSSNSFSLDFLMYYEPLLYVDEQ